MNILAKARALLGALAWMGVAPSAAANDPPHRIEVECPALDAPGEQSSQWRAAFETRALVTLSLADAPSGSLRLRCDEKQASLSWAPSEADHRQLSIAVPSEPPALIELAIAGLWTLLSPPPSATEPSIGEHREPEPPASPPPVARNLGLAAEFALELPLAHAWGTLGGRFGMQWSPTPRLRTTVFAGARSALSPSAGFALRYLDAGLGGDLEPFANWPVELGALLVLSACEATAPPSAMPNRQRAPAGTLVLRARLRWAGDPGGISVGPEGLVHVLRPRIVIDGQPLATAPGLALGLSATFWSQLW